MKSIDDVPDFLKPLFKELGTASEQRILFNEYCGKYSERFGEPYGFYAEMGNADIEKGIEDIKECLKTGKRSEKPWMNPVYRKIE